MLRFERQKELTKYNYTTEFDEDTKRYQNVKLLEGSKLKILSPTSV